MKRLLIIIALCLLLLVLAVAGAWWWLTSTRGGAQWALSQTQRFVDTLTWSRAEGGLAGGLILHDVQMRQQDLRFDAKRLELAVRIKPLPKPAVRVYWLRGYDLELVLPESDDDDTRPDKPLVLPEDLSSPVPVQVDELRLERFAIQSGDADPVVVDRLALSGRLDERLQIGNLQAQALDWDLEGEVDAGLRQPFDADAHLNIAGRLAEHPIRATVAARLVEDTLSLQADTEGLIQAHLKGTLADIFLQPVFDLEISSEQLAWPDVPASVSDLTARLSGRPQQWRLEAGFDADFKLETEDRTTDIPSRWQLIADGGLETLAVQQGRIDLLAGTINLTGNLRWDVLAADANVQFESLDFAPLYPDFPHLAPVSGQLAGRYGNDVIEIQTLELSAPPSPLTLSGSGLIDANADTVTADLAWRNLTWPPIISDDQPPLFQSSQGSLKADGRLSDWRAEVQALLQAGAGPQATLNATLSGGDDMAIVEGLELVAGPNRLHISSTAELDVAYRLSAPDLAQLWPGLAGRLELHGQINPQGPVWSASGQGQNLVWQDIRLASLSLESQGSLDPAQSRLDTHLIAEAMDLSPWEQIERLELRTEGTCARHDIYLYADADRANIRLAGQGEMPACPPDFQTWQAQWSQLDLQETVAGDWSLAAPASSRIGANGAVALDNFCLASTDDHDGRLCISRLEADGGHGTAEAALTSLPANLILGLTGAGIRLSSQLDGRFNAAWGDQGIEALSGRLDVGRGWLRQQGMEAGLRIESGSVQLTDAGVDNLHVALRVDTEGDSRVEADVQLLQWQPIDNARLDGTAQLHVPDLSAYSRLVPELDRLEGALQAQFNLGGALVSPDVAGQFVLDNGLIESVPLGLRLSAIALDAQTDGNGLSLSGGFNAGDGRAVLSGHIAPGDDGWLVNTRLRGEALQLFDADWMQLRVSPDFSIDMSSERILIDGRIDIPHARLGLPPGSENKVATSGDVIVLGEAAEPESAAPPIPLTGSLVIGLGHDVRFEAAGAQSKLTGEVTLAWREDAAMPIARGTIELADGHFRQYGQNLNFIDSEVQFAGRPVNDPRLDIRAVREIFADPVVEHAGIHIRGSAGDPVIELYTDPPTNEEKALAYIVTGSDFDHASGQGAFNVGFFVMPKLFVSYGIGLFETGNVLSASYRLSRRWGLRASSSERDTGADFLYTIDR